MDPSSFRQGMITLNSRLAHEMTCVSIETAVFRIIKREAAG